jgi:hypothetical protein
MPPVSTAGQAHFGRWFRDIEVDAELSVVWQARQQPSVVAGLIVIAALGSMLIGRAE